MKRIFVLVLLCLALYVLHQCIFEVAFVTDPGHQHMEAEEAGETEGTGETEQADMPEAEMDADEQDALIRWEDSMRERINQMMIPMVALRNMPKAPNGYIEAGETIVGVNYSSVLTEEDGKNLVGHQESLSTYYSALENPASIMYTQDIYQNDGAKSTYYGTVCSGFVSYVIGSNRLLTTTMMAGLVHQVDAPWVVVPVEGEADLHKVRAGDLLLNTVVSQGKANHVRIVSDVVYDEEADALIGFNLSESWKPFCRTAFYSNQDFLAQLEEEQPYRVVRIEKLGQADSAHFYFDTNDNMLKEVVYSSEVTPVQYSRSVYPDLGDGGKYALGESVFLYIPDEEAKRVTYAIDGREKTVGIADLPSKVVNDVVVYELSGLSEGTYSIAIDTAKDDPCKVIIVS